MTISALDLFKIGIGPSSSHTVGPMRAGHAFVQAAAQAGLLGAARRVQVRLYGSLAATGIGHGTDRAVVAGLMGLQPDGVDPDQMADAVDAVVRAEAGLGPPTALTAIVLELLGFDTVEGMFRAALGGRIPEADRLRLCPPVFEAAAASDAVAAGILIKQAQALSGYAIALARRCGMLELAFDVVLSGSVFKGVGPLLIETITREIARVAPRARVIRPAFEPVVGSLLLAYDAAGIDVTGAILENVAATLPGAPFFDTQDGRGYRPMQRLSGI